jgi:transposase-like protein
VKVLGKWTYLYRVLDKLGNTICFYLSSTRNAKAAKRFLGKALNGLKEWEKPEIINTDKAPTYGIAISELKAEGKCPEKTMHREAAWLLKSAARESSTYTANAGESAKHWPGNES